MLHYLETLDCTQQIRLCSRSRWRSQQLETRIELVLLV
jgi:hypothetical protein